MRYIVITLCVLFLTACASTSPTACNLERWQAAGANNAISGGHFDDHHRVNSCSNEAPLAYKMGFEAGLEKYCTYEQGLFGGQHGKAPAQSCNDARWIQYEEGFLTGREILATNQRLEVIASQLELKRMHLLDVESIQGTGPLNKVDYERVNSLRAEMAALASEKAEANSRLFSLQSGFKSKRKRELSSL
ncbi:MAG: DUF2799 domain-containing protein [Gammaproteobacteria bacterium]